jgi:hypothetical protein
MPAHARRLRDGLEIVSFWKQGLARKPIFNPQPYKSAEQPPAIVPFGVFYGARSGYQLQSR